MAVLSFLALTIPFIPLLPTLIIPVLAYFLTPISLTGAWAAWALGMVGSTFLPAAREGLQRLDQYLIRKKNGDPVPVAEQPSSPDQTLAEEEEHLSPDLPKEETVPEQDAVSDEPSDDTTAEQT